MYNVIYKSAKILINCINSLGEAINKSINKVNVDIVKDKELDKEKLEKQILSTIISFCFTRAGILRPFNFIR